MWLTIVGTREEVHFAALTPSWLRMGRVQAEAREDAELRAKHGSRWARPASAALSSQLTDKLAGVYWPTLSEASLPVLGTVPRNEKASMCMYSVPFIWIGDEHQWVLGRRTYL